MQQYLTSEKKKEYHHNNSYISDKKCIKKKDITKQEKRNSAYRTILQQAPLTNLVVTNPNRSKQEHEICM